MTSYQPTLYGTLGEPGPIRDTAGRMFPDRRRPCGRAATRRGALPVTRGCGSPGRGSGPPLPHDAWAHDERTGLATSFARPLYGVHAEAFSSGASGGRAHAAGQGTPQVEAVGQAGEAAAG